MQKEPSHQHNEWTYVRSSLLRAHQKQSSAAPDAPEPTEKEKRLLELTQVLRTIKMVEGDSFGGRHFDCSAELAGAPEEFRSQVPQK